MIYLNGEELDVSNDSKDYKFAPIVEDYNAYIDSLRERFGNSVTYLTKQQPKRDVKTGNLRPVPMKSWPKEQDGVRIAVKGKPRPLGPFTMIWNESQVLVKDKIPVLIEKNFYVKEGTLSIGLDTDPDLAYFLQFHNVVRSKDFYIYDPMSTATEKANRYRQEQKVRELLFSEYSPLNKNIENLKTVARRWAVNGINDKTPDQIRVDLFDKVMFNQEAKKRDSKKRGIDEFLLDTNLGANVKAGELVAVALERGVLTYDKIHGEYKIFLPGRQVASTFFDIPANQVHRMRDFLIESLVMDDQLMRQLESSLGVEESKKAVPFDPEKIDDYKYQELQRIGASMGINTIGKKGPVLRQEVMEAYQAQAGDGVPSET